MRLLTANTSSFSAVVSSAPVVEFVNNIMRKSITKWNNKIEITPESYKNHEESIYIYIFF